MSFKINFQFLFSLSQVIFVFLFYHFFLVIQRSLVLVHVSLFHWSDFPLAQVSAAGAFWSLPCSRETQVFKLSLKHYSASERVREVRAIISNRSTINSHQFTNTKFSSLQNFPDQTQRKIQKYQEHSRVLHNSKIFLESNTNQIITDSHHNSKSLPIQAKQTRTGPFTTQTAQIRTSQTSPRSETNKRKKNERKRVQIEAQASSNRCFPKAHLQILTEVEVYRLFLPFPFSVIFFSSSESQNLDLA